jgi:hypothetical protein
MGVTFAVTCHAVTLGFADLRRGGSRGFFVGCAEIRPYVMLSAAKHLYLKRL